MDFTRSDRVGGFGHGREHRLLDSSVTRRTNVAYLGFGPTASVRGAQDYLDTQPRKCLICWHTWRGKHEVRSCVAPPRTQETNRVYETIQKSAMSLDPKRSDISAESTDSHSDLSPAYVDVIS